MPRVKRLVRIDWDTVERIIARVCADELDPGRLDDPMGSQSTLDCGL